MYIYCKDVTEVLLDKYYGCMLGLACGDAVGTAVEFSVPGTFEPLVDMVGGGPFGLELGQWTDDTSMALCLASSLIDCQHNVDDGFNAEDQIKKYIQWRDNGYMSSTNRCFDIGNTVSHALYHYEKNNNPYSGSTDKYSAGNGSIMRLAPVPLCYFNSIEDTVKYAELSSKVTHAADEAVDACHFLSIVIHRALNGDFKDDILFNTKSLRPLSLKIDEIRQGSYSLKKRSDIKGTGYVVESLEAALWCFYTTSNFKDAILKSANLGDDADTTAAICGQIAGAYYGADSIPEHWISHLAKLDILKDITKNIYGIAIDRCEG